jgi:hypothetical protein
VSRKRRRPFAAPRVTARDAAAFGPLPAEFVWQPWGFESPEFDPRPQPEPSLLDLRPDDTQFISVRDFVLDTEFHAGSIR